MPGVSWRSPAPPSCSAAMERGGTRVVSNWEWFKIVSFSLLTSIAITAASAALWWWLMK